MVSEKSLKHTAEMTNSDINFSIIIPCYNASMYIDRAINSALAQRIGNYEIIVVDDGSTDTTGDILNAYVSTNKYRISFIRQENRGPAAARNRGISESTGDYLLFLDADDELLPDALQAFQSTLCEANFKYDFVYAGHYSVNIAGKTKKLCPESREVKGPREFKRLIEGKGVSPTHGAIVIRKRCFQKLSYPESIRCNEDFVLFAHLFALYSGRAISRPVVFKYKREGSLRGDTQAIIDAVTKAPALLFDPTVLPDEYFKFKPLYVAKRYLEKARINFKNREFSEFRKTYHQSIEAYPRTIFKHRFLIRYLYTIAWLALNHG